MMLTNLSSRVIRSRHNPILNSEYTPTTDCNNGNDLLTDESEVIHFVPDANTTQGANGKFVDYDSSSHRDDGGSSNGSWCSKEEKADDETTMINDDDDDNENKNNNKNNNNTKSCDNGFTTNNSVFAESPYYDAVLQKEMNSLILLSNTLQHIGNQVTAFTVAGKQMVQATKQLSLSCQLVQPTMDNNKSDTNNEDSDPSSESEVDKKEQHPQKDSDIQQLKQALGPDVTAVLERFGETLSQIATEQENMCQMIETVLGTHLIESTTSEMKIVNLLKDKVIRQTENTEICVSKYLNGKHAPGRADSTNYMDISTRSNPTTNMLTDFSMSLSSRGGSSSRGGNGRNRNRKSLGKFFHISPLPTTTTTATATATATTTTDEWKATKNHTTQTIEKDTSGIVMGSGGEQPQQQETKEDDEENKILLAEKLANWKCNMNHICVEQTTAELQRLQLFKKLADVNFHSKIDFCNNVFKVCQRLSDFHVLFSVTLANGTVPYILKKKINLEKSHIEYLNVEKVNWQEKESLIMQTLSDMKHQLYETLDEAENLSSAAKVAAVKAEAMKVVTSSSTTTGYPNKDNATTTTITDTSKATCHHTETSGISVIVDYNVEKLTIDDLEKVTGIWDIPVTLASLSPWFRTLGPGIIIEGWLYQRKRLSMLSLQCSWHRSWYILKEDGIYCLQPIVIPQNHNDDNNNNNRNTSTGGKNRWRSSTENNHKNSSSYSRIKICDTHCTVREIFEDNTTTMSSRAAAKQFVRFCFELTIPNQRQTILLQARGPRELRMWVDNIRSMCGGNK